MRLSPNGIEYRYEPNSSEARGGGLIIPCRGENVKGDVARFLKEKNPGQKYMILACHTVGDHCTEKSIKTFESSDPDCIATVDCKFDLNLTLHTNTEANELARERASSLFGQLKRPNTEISRTNTMKIAFPARFIEPNLDTLPDQLLERINNYGMVKISFHEENLLAGNIQIMPVYGTSRGDSDVTAAVSKLPSEFAPRKAQTIS